MKNRRICETHDFVLHTCVRSIHIRKQHLLNHSVPLHSERQKIVAVRALALAGVLLVPLLLGAQTGILDTQSAQNQQQGNQQGTRTNPFPTVPEIPRVNITNVPGEPGQQPAINQPLPVILPPEPDIEFQQFVNASLGYNLPIFGQNLFQNVPSTFAPLDYIPVAPDYMVGPGDELLIRGWGQINITNYRYVVQRDGSIYIPTVGTVNVAGIRFDHLTDYLKSAIGRPRK